MCDVGGSEKQGNVISAISDRGNANSEYLLNVYTRSKTVLRMLLSLTLFNPHSNLLKEFSHCSHFTEVETQRN